MSGRLTILGLGPGNPAHRTIEAVDALASAGRILLRTGRHPGIDDLLADARVSTCDDLYDAGGSFDAVYTAIVQRALAMLDGGDLLFAVPGHPMIGERTVSALIEQAGRHPFAVRVVEGLSAIDVAATALNVDPMADEVQIVDATEIERFLESDPFNGSLPDVSPLRPVLLAQVYSRLVASAAKVALTRLYPDEHPVAVLGAAGVPGQAEVRRIRLFELDRVDVDHLTSVWIPPLEELDATTFPLTLFRIAARLRRPDGCPWDRKQTYASLRDAAIEEAYEVASAIDDDDPAHLAEELGDLALQVAMQAQIADELGDFSIGNVLDEINRKLIRRHPHVFGAASAGTPDAVVQTWNEVKAAERAAKGDIEPAPDPFDRLPRAMPVLNRIAAVTDQRDATGVDAGELGDRLLALAREMAAAGLDPEQELERAYRRDRAATIAITAH